MENKSSIEGAEVERATHHGLRNVKNANYPEAGPRVWQPLQFTTEQGTSRYTTFIFDFPFLATSSTLPTASSYKEQSRGQMTGVGLGR